ncbi:hypothetical protein [Vogesella indigofera]|uniref:hypothetical protein n=1 Tax=Vogesella indigofera TaxID=45465 RepID=UPI00234EBEB6|nr:hypothetical protein [Vogesella indigofera]MDC7708348.1 hypothetical protein [Vogesella indigofera]MDC7709313.1 hypothetical protein [Vogesella indigofera]
MPHSCPPFVRLGLLLACASLGGCITIQALPNPVREVFTFGFSTATEMQAMAEKERQASERRLAPYPQLCIEWNERVTVPDFLRVVEDGLRRRGVASQVYAPGTLPAGCVVLSYAASRAWEQDFAYMSHATLALRKDGNVLAKVEYEPRRLGFDKWASTEAKLIFLLDQLLFSGGGPRDAR